MTLSEASESWLSIREAARRMGVAPKTMRELLREHGTPILHLKGNMRVREEDFNELMRSSIRPLDPR